MRGYTAIQLSGYHHDNRNSVSSVLNFCRKHKIDPASMLETPEVVHVKRKSREKDGSYDEMMTYKFESTYSKIRRAIRDKVESEQDQSSRFGSSSSRRKRRRDEQNMVESKCRALLKEWNNSSTPSVCLFGRVIGCADLLDHSEDGQTQSKTQYESKSITIETKNVLQSVVIRVDPAEPASEPAGPTSEPAGPASEAPSRATDLEEVEHVVRTGRVVSDIVHFLKNFNELKDPQKCRYGDEAPADWLCKESQFVGKDSTPKFRIFRATNTMRYEPDMQNGGRRLNATFVELFFENGYLIKFLGMLKSECQGVFASGFKYTFVETGVPFVTRLMQNCPHFEPGCIMYLPTQSIYETEKHKGKQSSTASPTQSEHPDEMGRRHQKARIPNWCDTDLYTTLNPAKFDSPLTNGIMREDPKDALRYRVQNEDDLRDVQLSVQSILSSQKEGASSDCQINVSNSVPRSVPVELPFICQSGNLFVETSQKLQNEFLSDSLRVLSYDIETQEDPQGRFPHPTSKRKDGKIGVEIATICASVVGGGSGKTSYFLGQVGKMDPRAAAQYLHDNAPETFGEPDQENIVEWFNKQRVFFVSCRNESMLIRMFAKYIKSSDPDIITGYNIDGFDTSYLYQRAHLLSVAEFFYVGRVFGAGMKTVGLVEKNKLDMQVNIPGRAVVDLMPWVRDNCGNMDRYSLKAVCLRFLDDGQEKMDLPYGEMFKLLKQGDPKGLSKVAAYCMVDAVRVNQLVKFFNTISSVSQMAKVRKTFEQDLVSSKSLRVASNLLWVHARLNSGVMCNKTNPQQLEKVGSYDGGKVLDPKKTKKGYLVYTLDFASLYPSIIREYGLCAANVLFEQKNFAQVVEELEKMGIKVTKREGYAFVESEDGGLLPKVLGFLLAERKKVKKMMKNPALTPARKEILDDLQKALKVAANSLYGANGHDAFPAGHPAVAKVTTFMGRLLLTKTEQLVMEFSEMHKLGLEVVYGDTDSVFVAIPGDTLRDHDESKGENWKHPYFEFGERISAWITERLGGGHILLELEKLLEVLIQKAKKNYTSAAYEYPDQEKAKPYIRGAQFTKRSFCPWQRDFVYSVVWAYMINEPAKICEEVEQNPDFKKDFAKLVKRYRSHEQADQQADQQGDQDQQSTSAEYVKSSPRSALMQREVAALRTFICHMWMVASGKSDFDGFIHTVKMSMDPNKYNNKESSIQYNVWRRMENRMSGSGPTSGNRFEYVLRRFKNDDENPQKLIPFDKKAKKFEFVDDSGHIKRLDKPLYKLYLKKYLQQARDTLFETMDLTNSELAHTMRDIMNRVMSAIDTKQTYKQNALSRFFKDKHKKTHDPVYTLVTQCELIETIYGKYSATKREADDEAADMMMNVDPNSPLGGSRGIKRKANTSIMSHFKKAKQMP